MVLDKDSKCATASDGACTGNAGGTDWLVQDCGSNKCLQAGDEKCVDIGRLYYQYNVQEDNQLSNDMRMQANTQWRYFRCLAGKKLWSKKQQYFYSTSPWLIAMIILTLIFLFTTILFAFLAMKAKSG
jgi:hypothetical protein